MTKKKYLYIAAALFLIVALVHLLRIISGFSIQIAGIAYPLWLSWTEMILAFALSFFGFRLAQKD